MDYTKFKAEDFAADERFVDWVNQKSPDADGFWAVLISEYPELIPEIDKARALVVNLRRAQEMQQDQGRIDFMWQNIREKVELSRDSLPQRKSRTWLYAVAASVALMLVSTAVWYVWNSAHEEVSAYSYYNDTPEFIEKVNESGTPLDITLEDGTVVTLENNSRLKYKNAYLADSVRDVYLMGEAFFNVVKSPKPFFVHTNEVVTEVLGTSFRVQAHKKNVVVSVKTGKVSVYALTKLASSANEKKKGVVLLPNQQVSYEREQQSFDKKLVEAPEIITPAITKRDFIFENAAIKDVFKTLEDAYGIEIMFNEEVMKNCFITAPLGSEPLYEKLKIVCQTIGADYEIIDAKVIISSSGC